MFSYRLLLRQQFDSFRNTPQSGSQIQFKAELFHIYLPLVNSPHSHFGWPLPERKNQYPSGLYESNLNVGFCQFVEHYILRAFCVNRNLSVLQLALEQLMALHTKWNHLCLNFQDLEGNGRLPTAHAETLCLMIIGARMHV